MAESKECEVCGETKGSIRVSRKHGMTLCNKHYNHMERYGEIQERTRSTPNEFIVNGDVTEIVLYDGKGKEISRTIVDTKHIEKLRGHKWCLSRGYVVTNISKGISERIHRVIMDCPEGMYVDHISHDTLDNRECNLRICTNQENAFNSSLKTNNTSGYTGVGFYQNAWVAHITVDGNYISLGRHKERVDAIEARRKAEVKYFGDFRYKDVI